MNGNGEAMTPREASGAQVSKMAQVVSDLSLDGRYTFRCVGPREEDRPRYCELRDMLSSSEIRLPDELAAQLHAEFAAIPLEEKWTDDVRNLVTTVGKNLALDTILAGSAYTVVGPFMGLTQASPTANAADTMGSHAGWAEAGNANAPTYTAPRKTVTFSAASAGVKASTGTYTYAITSSGTVGGAFMVYGTGAVSTIDNTSGTLLSCGAFTGGNKSVNNGDSLTVTWQLGM